MEKQILKKYFPKFEDNYKPTDARKLNKLQVRGHEKSQHFGVESWSH